MPQDRMNVYIIDPLTGGNSAGPYLRSVVEELRVHDAEAKAMGDNAFRIIRDILHPDNMYMSLEPPHTHTLPPKHKQPHAHSSPFKAHACFMIYQGSILFSHFGEVKLWKPNLTWSVCGEQYLRHIVPQDYVF